MVEHGAEKASSGENRANPTRMLEVRNLSISYGSKSALRDVTLDVRENEIFGIIGPANAGKTSFLQSLNRMDMFNSDMQASGEILFDGRDIRRLKNVYALRSRIGVVFPLPVGYSAAPKARSSEGSTRRFFRAENRASQPPKMPTAIMAGDTTAKLGPVC